ncbi:hypothetical protein NPX13_g6411 [Xylaria arbuscula]|uniref:Rhodopsin domain-containing protein n=1 Tax=Xylaria arbuscula TaxID=114810 RepID=A0A9W8NCF8_9PEZI|nr:hypothetical protein NPX13_g6411 [Xylaria arbuscula]
MDMITNEKQFSADNITKVAMPSTDPFDYTSTQQGLAIGIVIGFTALAFVVLCVRVAGRVSSHQFALDDTLVCIAMRLFGQRPGVRRFIVWLNAANIGMMIGVFFGVVFQCIPISKTWEPNLEGTCVDRRVLFTVLSSFNIFTDILMLALPLRIFISLKIPRRTKIALMFVFLLGFLTTITSMVRLALLVQGLFMLETSLNPDANIGFVTSAIETNLALITASAPALRPLLRTWFPKIFRVDREGITGNTERRVLGTAATRMTRLKSQTQLHSQTQRKSEEAAMPFNIKKTDIVILHNTGVDNSRPSTAAQGLGGQQQTEKWI